MKGGFNAFQVAAILLLAPLGGCGGGEGGNGASDSNIANEAVLAGDDQLTGDPELLNEAAADEAADMEGFGGNAAAGETGNAF